MFTKIAVFSCLLAIAFSAPTPSEVAGQPVPVVAQAQEVHPDGSFQWSYQSGDGSSQEQSGHIVGSGENAGEAIQGSASWTDKEGHQHHMTYVADENGYQPQSDDIPDIPAAIQRSLEWNAAHPSE